jgi:heme-degrading monooxygenase HmoA
MYLTMNRFKVKLGQEATFEEIWKSRDSHLRSVAGFKAFHLLKGPEREGYVLYASHTAWSDEESFQAWTRSDAFRRAHSGAGDHRDVYLGAPELEIFETVQEIAA